MEPMKSFQEFDNNHLSIVSNNDFKNCNICSSSLKESTVYSFMGMCKDCLSDDKMASKIDEFGNGRAEIKALLNRISSDYLHGGHANVKRHAIKLSSMECDVLAHKIVEKYREENIAKYIKDPEEQENHVIKNSLRVMTLSQVKEEFGRNLRETFKGSEKYLQDTDLFIVASTPEVEFSNNFHEYWKKTGRRNPETIRYLSYLYLSRAGDLWENVLLKLHSNQWFIVQGKLFCIPDTSKLNNSNLQKYYIKYTDALMDNYVDDVDDDIKNDLDTLIEEMESEDDKEGTKAKEAKIRLWNLSPNSPKPTTKRWHEFEPDLVPFVNLFTNINYIHTTFDAELTAHLIKTQNWGLKLYTKEEIEMAKNGIIEIRGDYYYHIIMSDVYYKKFSTYHRKMNKKFKRKKKKKDFVKQLKFSLQTRNKSEAKRLCKGINEHVEGWLAISLRFETFKLLITDYINNSNGDFEYYSDDVYNAMHVTEKAQYRLISIPRGVPRPSGKDGESWMRYCIKEEGKYYKKEGQYYNGQVTKVMWERQPHWFKDVYCEFREGPVVVESVEKPAKKSAKPIERETESVVEPILKHPVKKPVAKESEPVVEEAPVEEPVVAVEEPPVAVEQESVVEQVVEQEMQVSPYVIMDKEEKEALKEETKQEAREEVRREFEKIKEELIKKGLFSRFLDACKAFFKAFMG